MRKSTSITIVGALLLIAQGLGSCLSEEGCKDPNASNFNPEAKRSDGSCLYGDDLEIAIISPAEYSAPVEQKIPVVIEISDDNELDSARVVIDGLYNSGPINLDGRKDSVLIDDIQCVNRKLKMKVICTNIKGQSSGKSYTFLCEDVEPPQISLNSVPSEIRYNESVNCSVTALDSGGLSTVTLYLRKVDLSGEVINLLSFRTNNWWEHEEQYQESFSFPASQHSLIWGEHFQLELWVKDNFNNVTQVFSEIGTVKN